MRMWTFVIHGGSPISIKMPNNPVLDHDGDRTIWKMFGSEDQADSVQRVLESQKCRVDRYSEGETVEQQEERKKRMTPGD